MSVSIWTLFRNNRCIDLFQKDQAAAATKGNKIYFSLQLQSSCKFNKTAKVALFYPKLTTGCSSPMAGLSYSATLQDFGVMYTAIFLFLMVAVRVRVPGSSPFSQLNLRESDESKVAFTKQKRSHQRPDQWKNGLKQQISKQIILRGQESQRREDRPCRKIHSSKLGRHLHWSQMPLHPHPNKPFIRSNAAR